MSILNTNKLTWFENNGEPLKSGYVYVGQPLLDPQVVANQKTVTFTDSQGNEFTAPQPLRTNNDGAVQWNGKSIIASVEGDYSLLVLDSTETQINGGWTPTVSASSFGGGDLSDYREYGLTLADIKKLDVSPSDTVGSVGKITTTDGGGSDWLVVSNTGGTADDVDLIDFDNGLQGKRINNAAAYSGYSALPMYYVRDEGVNPDFFDIDSSVAADTFESVGPTGSGADNIWTALDSLPVGYKGLEAVIARGKSSINNVSWNINIRYRKTGATTTDQKSYPFEFAQIDAGDQNILFASSGDRATIPCDDQGRFDIKYSSDAGGSPLASMTIAGFYK